MIGRRHHELVHAVADLGILERPGGAQPAVARRPGRAVVGGLEDAVALHDRPEARRGRRDAAGRPAARDGPEAAWRDRSSRRARAGRRASRSATSVTPPSRLSKMPEASPPASRRPCATVRPEIFESLSSLVVAVAETLARQLPALAEVGAAPDARAVPLARAQPRRSCPSRDRAPRGRSASPRSRGRECSSRADRRRSRARSSPCAFPPAVRCATSLHLRSRWCERSLARPRTVVQT